MRAKHPRPDTTPPLWQHPYEQPSLPLAEPPCGRRAFTGRICEPMESGVCHACGARP